MRDDLAKDVMNSSQQVVAFVHTRSTDRWSIEVRDFPRFLDALGPDVVGAFARCFVHADRLVSLTSFAYHSLKQYPENSPAFGRNLQTMVWFVVGTLRELALAIRDLRSALAKRGMLEANSPPWLKLRELEARWEDDPFYREMRNIVAFHVDPDVVAKGLDALKAQERVIIIQGEGGKQDRTSLRLGLEALFMGTGKELADFDKFMAMVAKDSGESAAISEAFLLTLDRVGMTPRQDEDGA